MTEFIGVYEMAAEIGQGAADKTLAGSQPSGETYTEHARRASAERIVFTISMATVRGPTPPGTGV